MAFGEASDFLRCATEAVVSVSTLADSWLGQTGRDGYHSARWHLPQMHCEE